MLKIVVGLACAIALTSQPASAGWQATRWGMTVREAQKATNSVAVEVKTQVPGGHQSIEIPYRAKDIDFNAQIVFESPDLKLSSVILTPKDQYACMRLPSIFGGIYGPVAEAKRRPNFQSLSWWDKANKNKIALYGQLESIQPSCSIEYTRYEAPGASGL